MDFSTQYDPDKIIELNDQALSTIMEKIRNEKLGDEVDLVLLGLYDNLIQTTKESLLISKNGMMESIGAILRSQSEVFITLMYILKNPNIRETAEYFFNWSKFKNIQSAKLINKWKGSKLDESEYVDFEKKYLEGSLTYIKKHMTESKFDIYRSNNWIGFDKKTTSVRKTFKYVGYEKLYFTLYSPMSSMAHGTGIVENVKTFDQDKVMFKSMIHIGSMVRFQVLFLEECREKIVQYYMT